jgi:predicted PurR-regulated permease PerM
LNDISVKQADPDGGDDATAVVANQMTVQTLAVVTLAIIAVVWALSVAAEVIVPLLLAMMLKLMLQPVMRFLSRRVRLPMTVAALLLIVALFSIAAGIGLTIAVPAAGWIKKAPQGLTTLQNQLSLLRGPFASVQYVLQEMEHMASPADGSADTVVAARSSTDFGSVILSILLGTQQFFGRLVVLLVTLFFMLAAGDSMLRKLVEVIPDFQKKKHVVYIANEIERNISGYLVTIAAINAAVGAITGAAMYFCGIADPLLWGTVAFLLNFIPIVGPLIGVGTIFLVALLTFGHPVPALLTAAIYLGVHITESQLATPMLIARRFTLSPLLVIISLFFWYWLWGIPGALLSVPLLAACKIVCDRIPSLAPMGHMLGAARDRSVSGAGR